MRLKVGIAIHELFFLFPIVADLEDFTIREPASAGDAIEIFHAEDPPAHAMHHFMIAMPILAGFIVRYHHFRLDRRRLLFEEFHHRRNLLGPPAKK